MFNDQNKIMFATIVVAAALAPISAYAEGKNEIRAVAFSEDAGTTKVVVRGAQTPTFTVYKLERPSRVVIDVPQARLAEALRGHEGASVFTPNTWAVSTIAAQQLDDGGQMVRVIVTMARPGRYDVKTEGNDVVVSVLARDVMPKGTDPAALARAQADTEAAKRDAANATADAERARKAAAEQTAKAEAAQRAADAAMKSADEAKRQGQSSSADITKAKALADAAQKDAAKAKRDAANATADAERMRVAAEQATRDAKAEALAAKQQADAATKQASAMKQQADASAKQASAAQQKADLSAKQASAAQQEAATATKQTLAAQQQAATATKQSLAAQQLASSAKLEADAAKQDVMNARAEAAKARAEAEAARADVAQRRKEAEMAKADAARAKDDAAKNSAKTNADIAQARSEADAAKADAARARSEANAARTEANAAKVAAAADKRQAESDKQRADAERAEALKIQREAKTQLASLDKKALEVQSLEDKARAAHAAAQAREEAARDTVAKAERERASAELAANQAASARDRSSTKEREKMIAEAKTAEARLATAKRAAEDAEARRIAAETAAGTAKKDLDTARTTLASVEGQRTSAERAASEAARKRGEAEAAATDASRRRSEAESAVAVAGKQREEAERAAKVASKQRSDAEQQRLEAEQHKKLAEQAARDAQVAKVAADKQREVAQAAAASAVEAKHTAEDSLERLMAKRVAAEASAAELEKRSKAEAKAQAEVAAASQRQASDAEMAKARTAAARLADERKRAEADLADRRKAVAMQQAEADRLKSAAAQARDAAEREEKRRASLAAQRAIEEQQLADLKAAKAKTVAEVAKPAVVVAAKVAPVAVIKPAFVKDITFKGQEGSGRVDIAMTGEGQISVGEVTASYVELIIDNAELGGKLERKLDVSRFGSPVRSVSSFRDRREPNRIHLVAELSTPATPTVERGVSGVSWSFAGTAVAKAKLRTQDVPPQVVGGFGAVSTPIAAQSVSQIAPQAPRNRKVYRGRTVDFNFKDAPMSDLLRTIAETGGVNIVVPEGVEAKVTVRLNRVPWDQALEVILASHQLWYRRDGNLFRIAPRKELDAEDEAEAARREAMIKSESPRSEILALNYASAADLKPKLDSMHSAKGSIEVDERTNSLIINDIAGNREQITRLALSLDTQTPQISIEARIVEARSTFLRQFGIQWGGNASASAAGGNATGLVFPSSIGLAGGASDAATPEGGLTALPSDFAVNLPAAVGTGEGGALGMSLGSVGGNFNINLRLSALEDTGTVRIISAPKITVLNNKEAKISQGVSIPISVVSAAGTQTQFVQADLSLTVTPYVSQRDCSIAMKLNVSKNEPDFVNVGARGDPTILRKEATTEMLVADGETSVLGGIYTRNTGLAYKKLPFLGDIPVLGWLFKNRRENDDRTEILVFITPKITNKALLRCQ